MTVKMPLYYLDNYLGFIVIRCRADGKIKFRFRDTEKGHTKAAAKMREINKSQKEIHELLLFWTPPHVQELLRNG